MAEAREGSQTQVVSIDEQVEQLITLMGTMRHAIGGDFKRTQMQGMGMTQFMVLGLMEEAEANGPCTISALASQMNVDPATVVRSVDSLEKRGLVVRRRDRRDRRQVFVEFTEEGRRTRQELHQHFKNRLAHIFNHMSEEGRASLLVGLQEFIQVGQQERQDISS